MADGAHTFLFADLSGFTALTEAHGDDEAAALAARFVALARAALRPGGRIVKTMGDEVMVVTPDPASGVQTAVALAVACRGEAGFLAVRAGLHHGPAAERDGDYFGAAVNLAARAAAAARGGQILCTGSVVAGAAAVAGVTFCSVGAMHLKNVVTPVELFDIRHDTDAAPDAVDPVCRMRVCPDVAPARLPFAGSTWHFCSFECARAFAAQPDAYTRR